MHPSIASLRFDEDWSPVYDKIGPKYWLIGNYVQVSRQFGVHDEAGCADGPVSSGQSNLDLQQGFFCTAKN